jgi:hypothetical protein
MTLRVKLEIIPHGIDAQAREIGRLEISNRGLVHPHRAGDMMAENFCRYDVIDLGNDPGHYTLDVWHFRDHGAWDLVRAALTQLDIKGPFNENEEGQTHQVNEPSTLAAE